MNSYRWTVRVGLVGVGFLVTLAGLVAGLVYIQGGCCGRGARWVGAERDRGFAVHCRVWCWWRRLFRHCSKRLCGGWDLRRIIAGR